MTTRSSIHTVPVVIAQRLRKQGLSWRMIRDRLYEMTGQRFQTNSIPKAIERAEKMALTAQVSR